MFIVTYTAEHNHPMPTHRNSLAGSTRQKPVTPQKATGGDTNKPSCSSPVSPASLSPTNEKVDSREDLMLEVDEDRVCDLKLYFLYIFCLSMASSVSRPPTPLTFLHKRTHFRVSPNQIVPSILQKKQLQFKSKPCMTFGASNVCCFMGKLKLLRLLRIPLEIWSQDCVVLAEPGMA
ncbi:uncharacterized protein LOC132284742 [Cornus florida]|uniref:uncharacterized protein LOC132284742 n=1 Tax=Cornus florida TaxID=4283 RepID=UPI0028A17E88|nr:uncharacterized protein LOC132284742 [Cornus florida]